MTIRPEFTSDQKSKLDDVKITSEIHPLLNIFTLGYTESEPIEIYKDESVELKVKFRTLTPAEHIDIQEEAARYESPVGSIIAERMSTLMRAIITINHMPLILTVPEQEKYKEDHGNYPSPLEMSRIILTEKIRSMLVLDAMYEKYMEFTEEIINKLENIKKN